MYTYCDSGSHTIIHLSITLPPTFSALFAVFFFLPDRSFDSDTPIIAMTGNYQKEDLMTYLSHGMTDILAKPFTKLDRS